MRSLTLGVITMLLGASSAWADPVDPALNLFSTRPAHDPWHMSWPSCTDEATRAVPALSLAFPSMLLRAGQCPAGSCGGDRTQRRVSDSSKDSQIRELRHAAAVCRRSGTWPVARWVQRWQEERACRGRRWDRRALRREHRHGRVESIRRRAARQGRADPPTRSRVADDGRRRRLSRHDGVGAQYRAQRCAHL